MDNCSQGIQGRKIQERSKDQEVKAMVQERSLLLIKPDAIQRGLVGEIIARFEKKGFKLVGIIVALRYDLRGGQNSEFVG